MSFARRRCRGRSSPSRRLLQEAVARFPDPSDIGADSTEKVRAILKVKVLGNVARIALHKSFVVDTRLVLHKSFVVDRGLVLHKGCGVVAELVLHRRVGQDVRVQDDDVHHVAVADP